MEIITEDAIVNWIKKQKGILHTRKENNILQVNLEKCPPYTLVCLTGYDGVIDWFFQQIIHTFRHKIILITLETDGFTMKEKYINHPHIHHWFTWNKSESHPKLTCLPIGLNADRQAVILGPYLQTTIEEQKETIKRRWLCFNCNQGTHYQRGSLGERVKNHWQSFCDTQNYIPFQKIYSIPSHVDGHIQISVTHPHCYDMMLHYKFILSPYGAGYDCHRTWEALYLNCIPIVLTSPIDEIFEDLPVVIVKTWDEINLDFLQKKYKEIEEKKRKKEYKMEKLFVNYWLNQINKYRE